MDVPLARDEVRGRRGRIGGEDGGGADQRGELSSDPHAGYEHRRRSVSRDAVGVLFR